MFETLPEEIVTMIFKNLDPIHATCLGLTRKDFYEIYKVVFKDSIPVELDRVLPFSEGGRAILKGLLWKWMNPQGEQPVTWDPYTRKFVTLDTVHEQLATFEEKKGELGEQRRERNRKEEQKKQDNKDIQRG
jgi:hypothetical protein